VLRKGDQSEEGWSFLIFFPKAKKEPASRQLFSSLIGVHSLRQWPSRPLLPYFVAFMITLLETVFPLASVDSARK
jgi:hypothetical protein